MNKTCQLISLTRGQFDVILRGQDDNSKSRQKPSNFALFEHAQHYAERINQLSKLPGVFKLYKCIGKVFSSSTLSRARRITTFDSNVANSTIFIENIFYVSFPAILRKVSNIDSAIIVVASEHTVAFSGHQKYITTRFSFSFGKNASP